jgi:hypothetical protein
VIENEFRRIYEAIGRPDDKEKYDKFIKLLRSKAKDTMLASIEYCKLPSQRE